MKAALLAAAVLFCAPAGAQRARFQIDTQTPEGLLLQMAGSESDEARKIELYQEFLQKYPDHPGRAYALNQVQPLWLKTKAFDKVISGAKEILAAEPDNAPAAYNALQACEEQNDAACIVEWANATIAAAKKKIESKEPEDEQEAERWKAEVDFAKQVTTRAEYSFYAMALKSADPKVIVLMGESLEKANPQSEYMGRTAGRAFVALIQMKDLKRALEYAENADAKNFANEDMLVYAADTHLTSTKNYDKAILYAEKLISMLPAKEAPEGMAPADWEAKKTNTLARGYWIAGIAYGVKEKWPECEKVLETGLPVIQKSASANDLLPGAYFYLGLANYNLAGKGPKRDAARLAAAQKHWSACAKMKSPFQARAQQNLAGLAAGR
ncbi:MAG: hypothetical protein N2036_10175 [Bryobacteraceae bacterium]|nr:hypothetical protein [Bryobacteraceae bacterium]MCX7604427.1 hypothetical protein [Bryobacteraceae bacterium]